MSSAVLVRDYINSPEVRLRAEEVLRDRAPQFLVSLLSTVNGNPELNKCAPSTVLNAAMTAAGLNLPISSSLGFAYIIPYNDRKLGLVAQFQIGYKGLIQLALRSGQYAKIAATEVYEGQLVKIDPLYGNVYDFDGKVSDTIIGYASYLSLTSGFSKDLFMSVDEIKKHGKKYSKSFKKDYGVWVDEFDSMAKKTVLKLLLSKFGLLSPELVQAIQSDQAVIDDDGQQYLDNPKEVEGAPDKQAEERSRIESFIASATDANALSVACGDYIASLEKGDNLIRIYEDKVEELKASNDSV